MNITEQDLFNFVSFPEKLSKVKIEYIQKNLDLFKSELEMLNYIKSSKDSSEFNLTYPIRLSKVANSNSLNGLRLAAAGDLDQHFVESELFCDSEKRLFAKVIPVEADRRIYVFDSTGNPISNIKIILTPGDREYELSSNQISITIDKKMKIENMDIARV